MTNDLTQIYRQLRYNKSATILTYPTETNLCIGIAGGEVFLWFRGRT